jgi:capsular exopolysaccharide synthesis family protein
MSQKEIIMESNDTYSQSTALLRLPAYFEEQMSSNLSELAMVESNIKGAGNDIGTIYVTSCNNSEGKSTTAIQMAYALTINAQSKVLLVDGNPRSPILHTFFGAQISPGLSDFLYSDASPEGILQKTAYENLTLLTIGNTSNERHFFIQEPQARKFKTLASDFNYVVIDGNSILGTSDSILISRYFDAAVLTISCEETKWEVALHAIEKMKNIGTRVLGIVMNNRRYYIPKALYGKK